MSGFHMDAVLLYGMQMKCLKFKQQMVKKIKQVYPSLTGLCVGESCPKQLNVSRTATAHDIHVHTQTPSIVFYAHSCRNKLADNIIAKTVPTQVILSELCLRHTHTRLKSPCAPVTE